MSTDTQKPITIISCGGCTDELGHVFDGVWVDFKDEDGVSTGGAATCSKCGTDAMSASLWSGD